MSDTGAPAKVENPRAKSQNGGSSISDLTYRNYDGPLKTQFVRWSVVAQSGLRQTWGQGWFYILAGLPLIRFLMAGFLIWFKTTFIESQTGSQIANFNGEPEGQHFAHTFWSALCGETNSIILVIITLVIGTGIIAADNRANALLVYFSKPITKLDYLFGKWMSVFITLLGITAFPVFMLYMFLLISYRDQDFIKNEPWLGPHLLLAVLIPALLHSSLIVGISAWSKSPRIVAAIYASLYILGGIAAGIIGGILFRDHPDMKNLVQHLSIRGLIDGIEQNILHVVVNVFQLRNGPFAPPPDTIPIPKLWPLLTVAGGLIVASLTAAWLKIRAVEVVRG